MRVVDGRLQEMIAYMLAVRVVGGVRLEGRTKMMSGAYDAWCDGRQTGARCGGRPTPYGR